MSEIPVRAFLVIVSEPNEWEVPDDYWNAMEKHIQAFPTELKLPWPLNMRPQNVGNEISFSNMVQAEYVVESFKYFYSRSRGVSEYIALKIADQNTIFGLESLLYAADEGFLFETEIPIADVLREAGLKYTMIK